MFKFKYIIMLLMGLLATAPVVSAQTLTANITGLDYIYTEYQSGFEFTNAKLDGSPFAVENGLMFCIDFPKDSYWADSGYTDGQLISEDLITIENTKAWDSFSNTQNEALAIAQLGWLVDHFYEDHVLGDVDMVSTSAFANAIWEIMHDGGTTAGLDVTTGNFTRTTFTGGLETEMLDMVNAVKNSGVDSSYEWQRPKWVVRDDVSSHQDYLLLSVVAVPEPSSLAFVAFAALFTFGNRRRA